MRPLIAFFLCAVGILLPWRLRVWYAETLGWLAQGVYWIYSSLLGIIIKSLKKGKNPQ